MYEVARNTILAAFILAFPFWLCWTAGGIGATYFFLLPQAWHSIPYLNCVGIFLSVFILRFVFVPRIVVVNKDA